MKKIDFIVANIVSAVWAILTCVHCGFGDTIDPTKQIEIGVGWYIPVLNRYWDWLFAGLSYLTAATLHRGHWLPDRDCKTPVTGWETFYVGVSAFLLLCVVGIPYGVLLHRLPVLSQIPALFTVICIWTYSGQDKKIGLIVVYITVLVTALICSCSAAFLGMLIILISKILIWLVVNIFRSGFSTAWRQLWTSLVLGKNPFDEGDSGNVPAIDTVALKDHADYQQEARAQ